MIVWHRCVQTHPPQPSHHYSFATVFGWYIVDIPLLSVLPISNDDDDCLANILSEERKHGWFGQRSSFSDISSDSFVLFAFAKPCRPILYSPDDDDDDDVNDDDDDDNDDDDNDEDDDDNDDECEARFDKMHRDDCVCVCVCVCTRVC